MSLICFFLRYLFAIDTWLARLQVDYSASSFAGEPPRLRCYFIRDYKNARKGPAKPRDKFLLCREKGPRVSRETRGRVVNYSMRKREARRQSTLSRFPLQIFPDPFNFPAVVFTNFPPSFPFATLNPYPDVI